VVGVGNVYKTIDLRERDIADRVLKGIASTVTSVARLDAPALLVLRASFDERVVAEHLAEHFSLDIDLDTWFAWLRRLAEQTYENKALVFGCLIDATNLTTANEGTKFPSAFLERKRYRALSDGYRTAYRISRSGTVTDFIDIDRLRPGRDRYYPAWCEDLASQCRRRNLGICLTRQGDILVLDGGKLTFSYRFGRWQYWNHGHIVDLITNAARVQRVPPKSLSRVVRSLYRAALDVSFRRSGGLFVLLRSQQNLHALVRMGDAVGDSGRDRVDESFDAALAPLTVASLPRSVLADLASLDGAVVLANTGRILSYGSVLEPKKRRGILKAEGSRTKAAIGSSNYGLALKISSDGDITVYVGGAELIRV
jgi:hypothetical protein